MQACDFNHVGLRGNLKYGSRTVSIRFDRRGFGLELQNLSVAPEVT